MPGMLMTLWFIGLMDLYTPAFLAPPVTQVHDIVFEVAPTGEELEIDLFTPGEGQGPFPAVVFIHGGAWSLNDEGDYHDFARAIARAGLVGVTPNFRLTPPNGFSDQVADIKAAIRWIRANAADLNIDPNRIGIYGSSSGGHLAALAGTAFDGEGFADDNGMGDSTVQAAYYLFGVYELADSGIITLASVLDPERPLNIPTDLLPFYSPMSYVSGNEAPTYMMHGQSDYFVPIETARAFRDKHLEMGVPATLYEVPRAGHGFIKTKPWLRPLIFLSVRNFFQTVFDTIE